MQPENSGGGIGARLRAVGAALGELVLTRLTLVATEVEWLVASALQALLAGLAAVALMSLAVLTAVTATVMAVPESLRALAAAIAACVLGLAALGLFMWSARLARFGTFSGSLAELRTDLDSLQTTSTERGPPPSRAASPGHDQS
jgi:uncharacterized membrane protein YqjE